MPIDPSSETQKGDYYRHPDGTTEVVFAVEEGTVLTVREYPDETAYEGAVSEAEYVGQHSEVRDLPGPEAFEE